MEIDTNRGVIRTVSNTQIDALANKKVQEQNTAHRRTSTTTHHSSSALILQPALWQAASWPNFHPLRSSPQPTPQTPQRAHHAPRSPYHQVEWDCHCVSRGLRVVPIRSSLTTNGKTSQPQREESDSRERPRRSPGPPHHTPRPVSSHPDSQLIPS